MKIFALIIFCTAVLLQSCNPSRDYDPSASLDVQEQKALLWSVIRYVGRLPEGTVIGDRFSPRYDSFYREQVSFHRLDAYLESGDKYYFLISRRAPSLYEKRVATGGYVMYGEGGTIKDYEELFRTWKMNPDSLERRGVFLFDRMVRGEDLKAYETRNIGNTDFIEFPDAQTWYDKQSRSWKTGVRPQD
ncbi:MAG: hypothetical protein ACKO3B_09880 [Bacteroidota bacterium]